MARDWWRLWTESRAVCAAPVETPLWPPSEYTQSADSGAGVATREAAIPVPAAEPTAEAPAAASADAPGSLPSEYTPGAGSGAGETSGETGIPAPAVEPTAEAPSAGSGAGETSGETGIPAPAVEPTAEAPSAASADCARQSAVREHAGCRLRRRSGHRGDRLRSSRLAAIRRRAARYPGTFDSQRLSGNESSTALPP